MAPTRPKAAGRAGRQGIVMAPGMVEQKVRWEIREAAETDARRRSAGGGAVAACGCLRGQACRGRSSAGRLLRAASTCRRLERDRALEPPRTGRGPPPLRVARLPARARARLGRPDRPSPHRLPSRSLSAGRGSVSPAAGSRPRSSRRGRRGGRRPAGRRLWASARRSRSCRRPGRRRCRDGRCC